MIKTEYNNDLQKLLIEFMISDATLFMISRTIIKPEYWDKEFRKSIEYIIDYVDEYKSLPTIDIMKAETRISYRIIKLDNNLKEWFYDTIEQFCKHKSMELLIWDGPKLIEKGSYAEIEERSKKNVLISLQKDLGTDYFDDPKSRIEKLRDKTNTVSTGWKSVDDSLYGGFNRGELTFFAGGPGCVVHDTKINIMENNVIKTIEISELYEQDFDTRNVSVSSPDGYVRITECIKKTNKDIVRIKLYNGMTVDSSVDHLFQKTNGKWFYSSDLKIGDELITEDGSSKIMTISELPKQDVYDLSVDHINHRYYTGGICSHNTGKSLFLQNLAVNWSLMGLNVLYVTLELSENLVSLRLDAMLTKDSSKDVVKDPDNAALKLLSIKKGKTPSGVKPGRIQIKKMSEAGTTINDIRAYIKEFEVQTGLTIDALCLDYLDLLYPNSAKVDINNTFSKDKYTSEELRGLAAELNILCVTASQLNRCLTLDTKVMYIEPNEPISEYKRKYKLLSEVEIGDYILGSNDFVQVKNIYHQGKQKVYRITLKNGMEIKCTSNHRFLSNKGLRSIDTGLDVGMILYVCSYFNPHYRSIYMNKNINNKEVEIESIEYYSLEDTIDIEVISETNLFYANDILTHNSSVSETNYDVSHIAGGISKINTADNVIAILTTENLRASGEYQIQFLKTRSSSGVGTRVYLGYNNISLNIVDKDQKNPNILSSGEEKISSLLANKVKKEEQISTTSKSESSNIVQKSQPKKTEVKEVNEDPRLQMIMDMKNKK